MKNKTKPSDENGQKPIPFNPLAWGIAFFSFWISLKMIDKLPPFLQVAAWFFLVLSAVLWLSILIQPLRNLLIRPCVSGIILPLIFFVPLLGFTISFASSLSNLEGAYRTISAIGGFLWIIAYLLVMMMVAAELNRVGFWLGIALGIVLIGVGAYHIGIGTCKALTSDIIAGIILVALGIGSTVVVIKKPSIIWHKWPFV